VTHGFVCCTEIYIILGILRQLWRDYFSQSIIQTKFRALVLAPGPPDLDFFNLAMVFPSTLLRLLPRLADPN
jgi:hypothetical protein